MRKLRLAWDLLRAEGARGLRERIADRAAARRERRAEQTVACENLLEPGKAVSVLDVLSTPMAPRFGGVPTQMGPRLAEEGRLRPTALLSPEGGWWMLRTECQGRRLRARLAPCRAEPESPHGPPSGVATILQAASRVGARIVNLEGLSGWPPDALSALVSRERKLVLSLHDFALFCPRPNLVEEPHARFCGYSRQAQRCSSCLASTWRLPAGFIDGWRKAAGELLAAADAVVYPSEFLRRQHAALFAGASSRREWVMAPPSPGGSPSGAVDATATRDEPRETFHLAFVGAYRTHKGALVFEEIVRRVSPRSSRSVRWSIFGSGDPNLLLRARRLGVRVRGHYRAGGLVRLLREEGVDLALLLSIWPETFALTLSECRAAGVPVVAFAHGAIADRVGAEGGGVLVPPEEGAAGVAEALGRVIAGELDVPEFRGPEPGPPAARAAAERVALYRVLLGEAT